MTDETQLDLLGSAQLILPKRAKIVVVLETREMVEVMMGDLTATA